MSEHNPLRLTNEEKWNIKPVLYKRAGGHCEYPLGCKEKNIWKLTIDHFTPLCIAMILGWPREVINSLDNLMLLCEEHHMEKDRITPEEKEKVIFEVRHDVKPLAIDDISDMDKLAKVREELARIQWSAQFDGQGNKL